MTTINSGSGNITTSSTAQTVMGNRNGKRIAFSINNYGSTTAWICLSDYQAAAVGTGIPLQAGGTLTDSNTENYQCYQGTITAVDDGSSGATTIAFYERVLSD